MVKNATNPVLDSIDRELIGLLRDDARISVVTLAKKLKLARATIQNRIAKLERDGTIVGYTVKLKPDVEAHRIRAIMCIAVEGNRALEVPPRPNRHAQRRSPTHHQRPLGFDSRATRRDFGSV